MEGRKEALSALLLGKYTLFWLENSLFTEEKAKLPLKQLGRLLLKV